MNRPIRTVPDSVPRRYSRDLPPSGAAISLFRRRGILLLLILMATYEPSHAQGKTEEYHVKAGFLFHFAQLVDWPTAAAGGPGFDVCTLGDDPFRGELENTLNGKAIGSKPIRVLHLKQPQEASTCQVLFISNGENPHLAKIFEGLGNSAVMTVGESDDFISRGGMIRFCSGPGQSAL